VTTQSVVRTNLRHIAPSGTPIRIADLAALALGAFSQSRNLERFREAICASFGVRHCFFVSSGRAAMTLILRSLRALSNRRKTEVIVPSYTCYSVPASVRKAGLTVRVCDVDRVTLGYDLQSLEKMDLSNVLCIVTSNLYGIPDDLSAIERIALRSEAYLIDDAAQCMGGQADGRFAGTFGEAGLFSLDKGKNITTIEGGIIVTRFDEMANALRAETERLQEPDHFGNFMAFIKAILYAAFLRPGLYWIPDRLPFLGLGSTVYSEEYPVEQYRSFLAGLGIRLLDRLRAINQARVDNAQILLSELEGTPRLLLPSPAENVSPVYLRFPVRILDEKRRDRCIAELNRLGISASPSYPGAINDIPEVRIGLSEEESRLPGGRTLAGQIVTLPTHPYVRRDDLVTMVDVIRQGCTKEIPFVGVPG